MLLSTRTDLLKRQRIAVTSEGELVVLSLGNVTVKVPYETALLLSQWLRMRAKEAKRTAGDTSRHWSIVGTLSDPSVTKG